MADKDKAAEPGFYESSFDDYPGSIRFPHPFLYAPHFQEYWAKAIEPSKDLLMINWDAHDLAWQGAHHLIVQYGEFNVKGISKADFEAGRVPLKVQQWVLKCAREYIEPELGPKVRPVVVTLT